MARMVTVVMPTGEPGGEIYRGRIVKVAHELSVEGHTEKVYAIDTETGRRYARNSWIKGRGPRTTSGEPA